MSKSGIISHLSILLIMVGSYTTVLGQFGVRAKLNKDIWGNRLDAIGSDVQDQKSLEIGVDYKFGLKKRRVEFLPEISYSQSKISLQDGQFAKYGVGLHFNTVIYPLDFEEACDCPTFSKQNDFFKKGFFFHLSPGLVHENINVGVTVQEEVYGKSANAFQFKIGGGLGVDIGISEAITLTPLYSFNFINSSGWTLDSFPNQVEQVNIDGSRTQHQFQLRIGFFLR